MTKEDIASAALLLIGHPKTTDFNGPSAGDQAANALYEQTVLELIGLHRWNFAKKAAALTVPFVPNPATGWPIAYTIPAGVNVIYSVRQQITPTQPDECEIDFDRYSNELHVDAETTDTLVLIYGWRVLEADWPPYFSAVVRLKLASMFAVAVADDTDKANVYEGKFVRQLAQAKLLDSQGRTAVKIEGIGSLRRYHQGRP